jgi:hypothetical protein
MSIFVQIASYRDPQLIPTLTDLVAKAKFPDELKICVCWQHDDKEDISKFKDDDRFIFLDVPYEKSLGTCWARNMIQQYYKDEDYTLQLDSHHRFVQDWDDILIKMIKQLKKKGHKKPLLTGYIPSFDPDNDPGARIQIPWKMNFDRFIPEGAVFFLPASIDDFQQRNEPVPARFYSAHFCFTLGKFCKEVPHDPEYYFHGEEISIAARAYTHGYDLFHPHRVVIWHEYTRKGRTKQWDDDKNWVEKNNRCHSRNRKLFEMDGEKRDIDFGKYGFGKKRTLRDYERYAGIHFKKRAVQKYTIDNELAPNPYNYTSEAEWEKSFLRIFKHCIDVGYDKVPHKDYDFWCVAFKDKDGKDIYRKDADKEEIERMFNDPDKYCKVWREFNTEVTPTSWIVWPHSVSKGWQDPITGFLANTVS